MTSTATAALQPLGEARIALESVEVKASLQGLMSEVSVTQVYRNLESKNIEAVYTFPLPLGAVLLDLSLELNGRSLRGAVQAKDEADERYEGAIEDGDSAILLQKLEPGVFAMNVGNILPDERAVVRFRYAQLHHWQGDSLRFQLPTTIAPRYGDPLAVGLEPHQVPEYVLQADHGFSLVVRIEGELARADFDCPSHPVAVSTTEGAREISLSGGSALMDRDFVLVVREPSEYAPEGFLAEDGGEYLALASFRPAFPEDAPKARRFVKLVVDCSGSMGGNSIAQAKAALHEIVSLLEPEDRFNLTRFGSGFEALFPRPVVANEENVKKAVLFVEQIDANMGGTEMGAALRAAYRQGRMEGRSSDLLLITDGEVWEQEQVIEEARESGHRIFSVGVDSAVSESLVRGIAEATSGACELVSPRENMSERIVRHFGRIDQPRAMSVSVEWPVEPVRQVPDEMDALYAGDTLHVFGWFKGPRVAHTRLKVCLEDGRTVTQDVCVQDASRHGNGLCDDLPRLAAHSRLPKLGASESVALAVQHQLVTEYTSCVLVHERDEDGKAGDIPALRKVPHVLAAGWGGMGDVFLIDTSFGVCESSSPWISEDSSSYGVHNYSKYADEFLPHKTSNDYRMLIEGLNDRYRDMTAGRLDIEKLDELVDIGLDQETGERLRGLVTDECDEAGVVILFLEKLSSSSDGKRLSRHVRELIARAAEKNVVPTVTKKAVSVLISNSNREATEYTGWRGVYDHDLET